MSPRPAVVTGLAAEPVLAENSLTWDSLGFDPLIDHYRIHAVPGEDAPAEAPADPDRTEQRRPIDDEEQR